MATNNASESSLPSLVPSGSSQSTATANLATPRKASATMTLAALFLEAGLSPPAQSNSFLLTDIITMANSILKDSTWDELDSSAKTRLGFLIFKHQIPRLRALPGDAWTTALQNAVYAHHTTEYKTLTSFLRKGGDNPGNANSSEPLRSKFLRKHPKWLDADGTENGDCSIFAINTQFGQRLVPFVRFQTMESVVCCCICASSAIVYYMMLTTGTERDKAIGQYGINIGRFMRNNFTDEEVFRTIFRNDGGYPDDLIDRLLASALPTGRNNNSISFPVYLPREVRAECILDMVSAHIKARGPLLVCNFRVFPSYLDTSITEFDGDWKKLKGTNDPHHAFLITGVCLDNSTGEKKIVFEVQDSLPNRPFVNIGFDLLLSMGVQYKGIVDGAVFHGTSDENAFDQVHIRGSPRSGCPSVSSAEPQEFAAATPTFSDLSSSSSGNLAQSGNDTTDGDTGSSRRHNKPDWIGIDIPEGIDSDNFVLYT